LTAVGVEQAHKLAREIRHINFDAIYTSEMDRTIETAGILCPERELFKDARINDIKTGMANRPFTEFRKALADSTDPWNIHFGDGESFNDEKKRTIRFLEDLRKHDYKNVLIVTHGGVGNIIYGISHNLSNEETFKRDIDNASLFMISV
jgi:alpha-ribazole phosphatase/probable phosphoglycerate mutase